MGWFDGWWSGPAKSQDPLASIDPKVREFLQRESPIKYGSESPTHPNAAAQTRATDASGATSTLPPSAADPSRVPVPRESLYQDGRYAHLWKGYRSMGDVESETKTDHEKLMDVLDGFKDRKQQIGKAALENCAIQQEEWISCMKNGAWEDRLQMCRKQVQRFERCYTMQTRLLKALGYRSVLDRSPQTEEDIQMHADTLYLRMLDQEKALQDAKDAGLPAPDLAGLFPRPRGAYEPGAELRKAWDEKLEQLPAEERPVEEAALMADYQAKAAVAKDVQKLWDEQAEERKAREKEGKTTVADRFAGAFKFK